MHLKKLFLGVWACGLGLLASAQHGIEPEATAVEDDAATVTADVIAEVDTMAELTAADVLVAELSGKLTLASKDRVQAVFAQADARGAKDVVLLLDAHTGNYRASIDIMELIGNFAGKVHAYVEQEAIGPAALVLMACDSIYVAKTAIVGDASTFDESSTDDSAELTDYLQARARSLVAEAPFRNELLRAMTERDFTWEIDATVIKSEGKFLILNGREAAMRYALEGEDAPLLAEAIFASEAALREAVFADKLVADYSAAKGNIEAKGKRQKAEEASQAPDDRLKVEDADQQEANELANVFVVPIEGPIDKPQLYILRRALKEAIANDVEVVVIDMDTPGGRMDVMLDMMEALKRFKGATITYVNVEAGSAGSYIAVASNEIYFAPSGIMGYAEAIQGSGEEIPPALKAKINSFIQAKVRTMTQEHPYRADVLRAMSDRSFEFKLDGKIISPEGELLTLTADEALQEYGYPPRPLLSAGTCTDVEELLDKKLGVDNYTIKAFEVTWSEKFAKWFNTLAPALMGIGVLLLFIEFKTPSFGIIGGIGVFLIMLVFASNYFAGMAGYEEVLVFALGVILIAVELFVFPGTLIFGVMGLLMIFGSLLWALADVWPLTGGGIDWELGMFYGPALQLALGLVVTCVGLAIVWRFLPDTWIWKKMVLSTAISNGAASSFGDPAAPTGLPAVGTQGVAVTDMFPSGEVEIAGRRYQARTQVGSIHKAETIAIVAHGSFGLVVAKVD